MRSRLLSFLNARRHDARMRSFYGRLGSAGDLVFDIGANAGDRTGAFDRLGCRVVSVEPQQKCVVALTRRFGARPNVTVVQSAVGATEGTAEMLDSDNDVLSSLSTEWMARVKESGRFADATWGEPHIVPLTTLDHLIAAHGEPAFAKVDVEGYELEVLRGLSCPVRAVSFEFTPEAIQTAYDCIDRLDAISSYAFNVSYGESMAFELEHDVPKERIRTVLAGVAGDHRLFGDIHARRTDA